MAFKEAMKSSNSRVRVLLFVFAVFVVFMQAGIHAGRKRSEAASRSSPGSPPPQSKERRAITHPIPTLMANAEDKFRKLLASQSKTLQEAIMEYKRRYSRDPPKGFDEWFKFAAENKVKMIDEYDAITEDLAPFWELSGEEIRRRTDQVGRLPSMDIVRIKNGNASAINLQNGFEDIESGERARGFRKMMLKFADKLPDMDFPINAKAEGRVLVPWEHRKYPNMTQQDSSVGVEAMLGGEFTADWRGDGNVWECYRRICHPTSQARRLFGSLRMNLQSANPVNRFDPPTVQVAEPGNDFSFSETLDDRFNFCRNPWAHYQQGHFFSDWRIIPVLYPVFSPGKAQGYMDIRVPSHYYYTPSPRYTYGWDPISRVAREADNMEVPWENKTSQIFWRGATTGGGSTPAGFAAQYQRHRFVRMASDHSDSNRTVVFNDPSVSSAYTQAMVPVKDLNDELMDVAFVKATGYANYPGGRAAMRKAHRFAESVPLGEHWKYKYLIDFDGMGYSARFPAFLASDSAVVKSTVYLEYFTDWIQPWLHFIPLSQTYQEIYNIFAFFSGPTPSMHRAAHPNSLADHPAQVGSTDGDRRLRRIARAGKQWKQTIGRHEDIEAYVYRLALEWGRLWSDDRDSMNFLLPGQV